MWLSKRVQFLDVGNELSYWIRLEPNVYHCPQIPNNPLDHQLKPPTIEFPCSLTIRLQQYLSRVQAKWWYPAPALFCRSNSYQTRDMKAYSTKSNNPNPPLGIADHHRRAHSQGKRYFVSNSLELEQLLIPIVPKLPVGHDHCNIGHLDIA